MYRNKSFNELLSKELKDPEVAKEYLLASIEGEDGLSLTDALFNLILAMGTKEFSELVDMKSQNISRLVTSGAIPKVETYNRMLAPFNLQVKINVEKVA